MSFLAELRQRKVFRVAAAYLVVAWLVVQVGSIVLPTFEAPAWAMRTLVFALALGFPVAILLAWAVELGPGGPRLAPGGGGGRRIAAIAALLVALAVGWFVAGRPTVDLVPTRAADRSIAVLPFVNMSGDPANEYFSDGLAETTLDMLAQVPDLKVIARTSSFAFKGKPQDMREIGRALDAAHLLEGSVQQSGGTMRITVQLIRVSDGTHMWSGKFDRRLGDVFRIQDEIATEVVQALQLALSPPDEKRMLQKRTDNVAAYQEYLRGMALLPRRHVPGLRAAAAHFERAIALDPGFARAHVAAGDAYRLLGQYAQLAPAQRQRARQHLETALRLAPELGEAHVSLGATLENAGDMAGAEREYRRGIALAPGYATGHQWLAELLGINFGRFGDALPHIERARQLDPLSDVVRDMHLLMLAQVGRLDEALALSNRLIAERPDVARNYSTRAGLHMQRQDFVAASRDAATHARLDPESVGFRAHGCASLLSMNALDEARACAEALGDPENAGLSVQMVRAHSELASGRWDAARSVLAKGGPPLDGLRARLELVEGRPDAALAIYARFAPGLLATPAVLMPAQAPDALGAGLALLRTGKTAQATALLEEAIRVAETRERTALIAGRSWIDVVAAAYLGRTDEAVARLEAAVASGFMLNFWELDNDPALADFRADPRVARILAPARARAAAELAKVRAAGLL